MHLSAYETGRRFFRQYAPDARNVIEVGSYNVNGTLRNFAPDLCHWIGLDKCPGPGVDVVYENLSLPIDTGFADAVVSSSCLEHDRFFWNTFVEMARVCRPGGHIYINAPSNGPVHRHPVDCWRFYPDAAQALAEWADECGFPVDLVETEVMTEARGDVWLDFHAIYRRRD